MKKDIPQYKVEDLAIAIVPTEDETLWQSYVINLKDEPIESVLINSRGYGEMEGEQIKTSVLRHFFELVGPLQMHKIEPVPVNLFNLTNEYWVSFRYNGHMYDKKYVFVPGSLNPINFTLIPFLREKGVMIR